MLVDYAKNSKPTSAYHRWYKLLSPEAALEMAEFALGAAVGASRVARRSSDAIAEVIEEITEPIRPKRARKTGGKGAKTSFKMGKKGKSGKSDKSGKPGKSGTTRSANPDKNAKKSD
jgi:hypothetical protein